MNGKNKCKILKEIRKKIAEENDIEYITSECKFQGNCRGTCPKCEAELKYLEEELKKRRSVGKKVAVAGIAASMMFSATGCGIDNIFRRPEILGDMSIDNGHSYRSNPIDTMTPESDVIDGDIVPEMGEVPDSIYENEEAVIPEMGTFEPIETEEPSDDDDCIPLMGTSAPVETDSGDYEVELDGDIEYVAE